MSDVAINPIPFDSELATTVLDQAKAELDRRYGEASDGAALTPGEFTPPNGIFLVASFEGGPIGCVGIRRVGPAAGEVKRLWVDAMFRQQGIASALMHELETVATSLGFECLVLETGWAQPEAVSFYEAHGWRRVDELPVPIDGHPHAFRFTKP